MASYVKIEMYHNSLRDDVEFNASRSVYEL